MHHEPDLALKGEHLGHDGHKVRVALRQLEMARGDANPRSQSRQLRGDIIGAETEILAPHVGTWWTAGAQCVKIAVGADSAMVDKVRWVFRKTETLDIAPVRKESHLRRSNAAREQRLLNRANHAHGHVSHAAQQILIAIGQDQFQIDLGVSAAEVRQQRRQHLDTYQLAGGQPNGAGSRIGISRRLAESSGGCGGHRLGKRNEVEFPPPLALTRVTSG